ncbi:YcxB family protein [Streptomyces bambusae]|uniref:YcxB family protein n=1 Tax=Streptomyces bambusae TaxID=1550616 RepID=A0ABS6Z302_9ACTN|nr:YcxB family protein [Streptomyces bambusae]MBW5482143.1 hypothetical protein [Streptomyces bambusae]
MADIRQTTLTFSGSLTREEFDEAIAVSGMFRRVPWLVGAAVAGLVALILLRMADGGSPDPVALVLTVVYGVGGLLVPRAVPARMFRAYQAKGDKDCVVDESGIVVSHGGEEFMRVPWAGLKRYHETERLYVVVGRVGWKSCLLALPKRLFGGPGEADLMGALLDARVGRTKN